MSNIVVKGAMENNLKNVNIEIKKGKITAFVGLSGSGKSSLVFDTIALEATRQLNETFPTYIRNRFPKISRPKVDSIENLSTPIVVKQRQFIGDFRSTVSTITDLSALIRILFSRCAKPRFESSTAYIRYAPEGMCKKCSGIGKIIKFDFDKVLDKTKSLNNGAILFPGHQVGTYQWMLYANSGLLDPDKKISDYTEIEWQDFLHGKGPIVNIPSPNGKVNASYNLTYEGLEDRISRLYLKKDINLLNKSGKKIIENYTKEYICNECNGTGFKKEVLDSKFEGYNIYSIGELEIDKLVEFLIDKRSKIVATDIIDKIIEILKNIQDMGMGYLNLNRSADSLSTGEIQRLKLIKNLSNNLVDLIYIFDEPSIGLHFKDIEKLNKLIVRLRDKGNTVLLVEHNPYVIKIADEIVEIGPGSGINGGNVVFQGSYNDLLKQNTITANSLNKVYSINKNVRIPTEYIKINNATYNNLKNINVNIPKGILTLITGVSGAGKTSLACHEIKKQEPNTIVIDQSPIGANTRSSLATYLGIMDNIRKLFSVENNVDESYFSSNSKGGCELCNGKGFIKTEMAFMDPIITTCELCNGTKYKKEVLKYKLNNKSILDVLNMTVEEAINFFNEQTIIRNKLKNIKDIGMGYIKLGESTSILSGGEAQRIKIAGKIKENKNNYVIDEPTTGLHMKDTEKLMKFLNKLISTGKSLIVVDNNINSILNADWIIDMGPGAGKNGGRIIFEGTPEQIIKNEQSYTGQFLKKYLQ